MLQQAIIIALVSSDDPNCFKYQPVYIFVKFSANTANNNKTKTVSPSTSGPSAGNPSRSGPGPNYYEQQQPPQSSMNWPVNYGQSSSWIIEDDSQKHAANATNTSQQSVDGDHTHTNTASGDGNYASSFYC